MHEVVKLVTDVGISLPPFLAPPDHVILISIFLAFEHSSDTPGEGKHKKFAQHVEELTRVSLQVIRLVSLRAIKTEQAGIRFAKTVLQTKLKEPTILQSKM
jgi:hypothetical protein